MGVQLDRVLLHIDDATGPWDALRTLGATVPLTSVAAFDFVAPVTGTEELSQTHAVAEALFASACRPGCRLFLDPYVDLDRTNDAVHGLLDRLSNPRPAFHVARMMNTILFAFPGDLKVCDVPFTGPDRVLGLTGEGRRFWLILPVESTVDARSLAGIELEGRMSILLSRGRRSAAATQPASGSCERL